MIIANEMGGILTRNILFSDKKDATKRVLFIIEGKKFINNNINSEMVMNMNLLSKKLNIKNGLKFLSDMAPLSLIFDTKKEIKPYFDQSLVSKFGKELSIVIPLCSNNKNVSISIRLLDFENYCLKYSNGLNYFDFDAYIFNKPKARPGATGAGAGAGRKRKVQNQKGVTATPGTGATGTARQVNIANDEHWVHISCSFCGRICLQNSGNNGGSNNGSNNSKYTFTPPWFGGIFCNIDKNNCVYLNGKYCDNICIIIVIMDSINGKISLLNWDGFARHVINDELNEYFQLNNENQSENVIKSIEMFAFISSDNNDNNDSDNDNDKKYESIKKSFKSEIDSLKLSIKKCSYIKLRDDIATIGIKNNESCFKCLKNKKYGSLYNVLDRKNIKNNNSNSNDDDSKNNNNNGEEKKTQVLSHSNEWELECSRSVCKFLFGNEIMKNRLDWVLFDTQHFQSMNDNIEWYSKHLKNINEIIEINGKNVNIVDCAKTLLMSLKSRSQTKSKPKTKTSGSALNTSANTSASASAVNELRLTRVANDLEIMRNNFSFWKVLRLNSDLIKEILSNKYIKNNKNNENDENDNKNKNENEMNDINLDIDIDIMIDEYLNTISKVDKKEIVWFCDTINDITKGSKGKDKGKGKTERKKNKENEKISNLCNLSVKLLTKPCNLVDNLSQFSYMISKHLTFYINSLSNFKKKESMTFLTQQGLKHFKNKEYIIAINYFNTSYQLATMCLYDPSVDLAKAEYNCGATYHECLKNNLTNNNSQMVKYHAILYLQASLQHRKILETMSKDIQVQQTVHQIAMKKIVQRLEQLEKMTQ